MMYSVKLMFVVMVAGIECWVRHETQYSVANFSCSSNRKSPMYAIHAAPIAAAPSLYLSVSKYKQNKFT